MGQCASRRDGLGGSMGECEFFSIGGGENYFPEVSEIASNQYFLESRKQFSVQFEIE